MLFVHFFFFKQKTAYDMRISDWSSDVCSSDLEAMHGQYSRPPQSVIWATLSVGPIILILWRTRIASGIWRRLPTPLTNALAAAGRGTARATNATFDMFAAMSSAAIMLILWISGIVVL